MPCHKIQETRRIGEWLSELWQLAAVQQPAQPTVLRKRPPERATTPFQRPLQAAKASGKASGKGPAKKKAKQEESEEEEEEAEVEEEEEEEEGALGGYIAAQRCASGACGQERGRARAGQGNSRGLVMENRWEE